MNLKRPSKQANPISIVNHELKSQLFGIKAYAQLLEKRIGKLNDEKLLGYVERIDTQVDKLSFALSDFIDYIKITDKSYTLNQEFLHIEDIVAQSIKIFQNLYPDAKISVKGKTTRDIFADRNRLEKVFYTLFTNAAMYSKNTPHITVEVKELRKTVEISVKDRGVGIEKNQFKKIFEPFYTIPMENMKERAGLGLFVAKRIIDLHGGNMYVESEKGKGTTFTCELPL